MNGAIVVDDILVAQNLDLAVCHLDLHIFVQNPGGSVALQRRVLSACVSADVEVVIPVRNVVAFDVQIIEKPVLCHIVRRDAQLRLQQNIEIQVALVRADPIQGKIELAGHQRCFIVNL